MPNPRTFSRSTSSACAHICIGRRNVARCRGDLPCLVLKQNGGKTYDMDGRASMGPVRRGDAQGEDWARQLGDCNIVRAATAIGFETAFYVGSASERMKLLTVLDYDHNNIMERDSSFHLFCKSVAWPMDVKWYKSGPHPMHYQLIL
ncbi:hypothetical protein BC826DRAFT_1186151 [Russula brevipes]|nr:hypothetical protein BC826DRAFT_1186151 [Russula brevipes]